MDTIKIMLILNCQVVVAMAGWTPLVTVTASRTTGVMLTRMLAVKIWMHTMGGSGNQLHPAPIAHLQQVGHDKETAVVNIYRFVDI